MKKFLISLLVFSLLVPSAFAYYTKDGANLDTTGIVFEGATDNAFETSVNVTDPTADRTITIPDASGTVQLSAAPDAAGAVNLGTSSIVFEGATADSSETTVTVTDPTADRTFTIPDVTGTALTTATGSITSANLTTSITDETGSGAAVFANTPTLVTPVLGAATGTSLSVSGSLLSTSATNIGWALVTGANTACNTTCTNGCVFGQNTADETIVDCAAATADVCVCAGAS